MIAKKKQRKILKQIKAQTYDVNLNPEDAYHVINNYLSQGDEGPLTYATMVVIMLIFTLFSFLVFPTEALFATAILMLICFTGMFFYYKREVNPLPEDYLIWYQKYKKYLHQKEVDRNHEDQI